MPVRCNSGQIASIDTPLARVSIPIDPFTHPLCQSEISSVGFLVLKDQEFLLNLLEKRAGILYSSQSSLYINQYSGPGIRLLVYRIRRVPLLMSCTALSRIAQPPRRYDRQAPLLLKCLRRPLSAALLPKASRRKTTPKRNSLTLKAAVAFETDTVDGVNDEAEDFYAVLGVVRFTAMARLKA